MLWTEKDEETLRECRVCLDNCKQYQSHAAPWFELCIRMHAALEEAGLLERGAIVPDFCAGCVHNSGGCRKAYREAVLDESRSRVVNCKQHTTQQQWAALQRAAEKMKKRTAPQACQP